MKILFISYYSPDVQNAANERLLSFISKLSEKHQITSITSGLKSQTIEYPKYCNVQFEVLNNSGIKNSSFRQLLKLMIGNIDTDKDLFQFRHRILTLITEKKTDLVIGNNAPANILKLMHFINKKTGLPYISDLRDFDNFLLLKKNPVFTIKQKVYIFFKYYWIKKWLRSSKMIITTSEGIGYQLSKMGVNSEIIYNGYSQYSEKLGNDYKPLPSNNLTLGILGTIYRFQDFTIFIEGYKNFLRSHEVKLRLKLVGGNEIKEEIKDILEEIPNELIELTDWFDYNKSIDEIAKCDLLLYFGWKGYSGIYSAKIFIYLGLKKNIILCPGDEDVLEKLIRETKSGLIINKPDELAKALHSFYTEKQLTGEIKYSGNNSEIIKYSREYQANKFDQLINNIMSH